MGIATDTESEVMDFLHTEPIHAERVPPQNIDAECAVLGALMQAGDNEEPFFEIQGEISPNSFYKTAHKRIYTACTALVGRHEPVDLLTVSTVLEGENTLEGVGGVPYLNKLIDACPTTANIKHYAKLVRDAAIRRYLIRECAKIAAMADDQSNDVDDVVGKTEAAIMTIRDNKATGHLVDIKSAVTATLKRIQTLYDNGEAIIGLASGFHRLDLKLSGMQPGQYIIVAGRPGMGKSTLVQNIICNVAVEQKKGVALFSVETSWEAFTMRLLSQASGENFQSLRTGNVSDWSALAASTARVAESHLWVDSSGGITPAEIRGKLRQIQRSMEIDLIVVDYIQLMRPDGRQEGRRIDIECISADLKALAREFHCPIIVCSQLSRKCEERPDHRPVLSDLRETGALEQDADVVLGLYRGWLYDKKIDPKNSEVIILKNKDGPPGTIYMKFDMGVMTFTEVNV